MAPAKGIKHFSGVKSASIGQTINSRRVNMVRQGRASWLPVRLYSPEEALRKAGL